jgi:hypothetical protein
LGLFIAGVDEAGYGPLLGPLSVGLSILRIEGWVEGAPAPDLWDMLPRSVSRSVKGAGDRIVVADSKELKLPNSGMRRHPLTHLERGVLSWLAVGGHRPAGDAGLVEALGSEWPSARWYGGPELPSPLAWTAEQIAIAANPLREDLIRAGVSVVAMACRVIGENEFNSLVRAGGGKGATTIAGVKGHFQTAMNLAASWPDDGVRFVCDRLGGRVQYADLVADFAGVGVPDVRVVEETDERSRYVVGIGGRQVGVVFQVESEKVHLPIALASMTAKYVREMAMIRFNRYWGERIEGLRPTAGYWQDAKRWLKDAGSVLTAEERRALVRIA